MGKKPIKSRKNIFSINKKLVLVMMPVFQVLSTSIVVRTAAVCLNRDWALLLGFLFSMLFWSISFSLILLRLEGFKEIFIEKESLLKKKNIFALLLLVLTVIGAAAIYLVPNIREYSLKIFLLGIPLTIINSTCEEILWRGNFIKVFKDDFILAVIYPAFCFAAYHVSFQFAEKNINIIGSIPFIIMTLPLGLIYGLVAYRNGSIKWTVAAHGLSGIIAFGVPLSTSLANILEGG